MFLHQMSHPQQPYHSFVYQRPLIVMSSLQYILSRKLGANLPKQHLEWDI